METESQIEGQMKNQIRHLQEDDIDAVARSGWIPIWKPISLSRQSTGKEILRW